MEFTNKLKAEIREMSIGNRIYYGMLLLAIALVFIPMFVEGTIPMPGWTFIMFSYMEFIGVGLMGWLVPLGLLIKPFHWTKLLLSILFSMPCAFFALMK